MELYYSPMACSLASRIVCLEGGLDVSMRRADLMNKRVERGEEGDLLRLNAMGKVPTLVCDDGEVLTENCAVLLFLGDRAALAPREGTRERYRVVQWLSFVATELHKRVLAVVYSLDRPSEAVKDFARSGAAQPLAVLEEHLRDRSTLVGDAFTVADAYLVWALLLLPRPHCRVSLDPYPAVAAYAKQHGQRESVRAAVAAERREYGEPGWWTASKLG